MDFSGFQWILHGFRMDFNGFQLILAWNSHGFQWISMDVVLLFVFFGELKLAIALAGAELTAECAYECACRVQSLPPSAPTPTGRC